MRYLCICAFCIAVIFVRPIHLFSQRQQALKFERITIEQGLSQNTVFAILQGSKGFLWLGTEDGLNRWDGYSFKVYRHDPDDLNSLSNNTVQAIYEDESGTLWIGTRGGGLNRFDRRTESFSRYTYMPATTSSSGSSNVWAICGDSPGFLWIGTGNGLNRFDCVKKEFTCFLHDPDNPDSLSSNAVRALCKDRAGRLWIGTEDGGLNRLEFGHTESMLKRKGKFTSYKHQPENPHSLSHNKVYSIFIDKDENIWVGTHKGFNKFNEREGTFINYSEMYRDCFDISSIITSIVGPDNRDASILWIGTYGGGLYHFDWKKEILTNYQYNAGKLTTLSSNLIQKIYIDSTGIMWVGTDSGLNKFDKKKQVFGHWEMAADGADNPGNNNIWSIYKDHKGFLWLGTEEGLRRFDRKNNKCIPIKTGCRGTDKRRIHSICEHSSGILWIGTFENGLYQFNPEEGVLKTFEHPSPGNKELNNNSIITIYEDTSGMLWIGTKTGLYRYASKTGAIRCYKNLPGNNESLSHDVVSVIYEDRQGTLWIGTTDGLNKFHHEDESFSHWRRQPGISDSLSSSTILAICEDRHEMLWIGTMGGGLNKFDKKKGTVKHYLEKDGLPNASIQGILADEEGNLWMATNKGISKFDPENEIFKNYDVKDGLQSNEFNGGAYYKSKDGEMFFGGLNGFNAFYPDRVTDNPYVPPIVITGFHLLNIPVKIGENSPLKQSILETNEIVLSYRDYSFSFEFAALDFSNPDKNKYAYKMDGLDSDWIYTDSKRRFANYTNLDPGEYTFRVKGSNNDGVWNDPGTAIKIVIVPPITQTLWFRLLAVAAFTAFSYWLINFVKKYIAFSGFWKREKYIGKFKLLEKIGSGGMGTIYKAKDTTQRSEVVALKVLKEELYIDENYRKRFKQEAAIIDQLDHPNIVKVLERGQFEQKLFIVMEFLKGKTLAQKIAQEKMIDLMEILDIMCQISAALVKIHSKNIIHRDLKPENIMLTDKEGNCNFVKLLDFGLAKTAHQTRITQTGTVLGTLSYMAPEQIAVGRFSQASDVYSLGVIFYESLTGKVPFPGDNASDSMRSILNDAPMEPIQLRPELPERFNYLVMRMIEKASEDRPTAEEVLNELRCYGIKQTVQDEEE
jgi:ligand-binding sensor domain-containing protein/tRNA A-37 threonylcarbamoyl transferase component Bud32